MAQDSFPLDEAEIVSLFMSSVFYGILLVSFFNCMRVLLWSEGHFKPRRLVNTKMVIASVIMCIIASLDIALHLRHNLESFIWYNGPAIENFRKVSSWINIMTVGTYVAQQFVGDSILILRCWIVYDRSWSVIALPILLWLGTTVTGVIILSIQASLSPGHPLRSRRLLPFVTSSLCLSLATNVITTGLILYRIWRINSKVGRGHLFNPNSPLKRVVIALIESGLLYTLSVIILFVLYLAGSYATHPMSNAIIQIMGITFNLIISSLTREESVVSTSLPLGSHPSKRGVLHRIKIERHIDIDPSIELSTISPSSRTKESWQQVAA